MYISTLRTATLLVALFSFSANVLLAQTEQEKLLDALGTDQTTDYAENAFKSPYVINGKSIQMLPKGVLDFRILHRFGNVSGGAYELFGLDQAAMRLSFDYGVSKNFMIGIGRSNNKKEMDGYVKYRILRQSKGEKVMPITLAWVSGITVNGLRTPFPGVETTFSRRISYYHEIVLGRKFSEKFSLQFMPLWIHNNIVESIVDPNDVFALGVGVRWKFTKRVAMTLDYYYAFNKFAADPQTTPLSIGFDIETGGHVFQLHFSNATGMNERAIIQDENGKWFKGQVRLGFNLSRWFQVN